MKKVCIVGGGAAGLMAAYAAAEEPALPPELEVLHRSAVGRVYTYIIRVR